MECHHSMQCLFLPSQIWCQNQGTPCPCDDIPIQKWKVTVIDWISNNNCFVILMIPCVTVIKNPSYLHVIFFSSLYPSLKDKLKAIAKATYTHSRNLAYFVFTYKGLQALQEKLQGKSLQSHSFLAACVGGWLVFGENNNINSQVGMQTM